MDYAQARVHRPRGLDPRLRHRYGPADFDFSRNRIRRSVEDSLRLLATDHVDILQLHDIEFVELDGVFEDPYAELVHLRAEGKCRYIGMTPPGPG